MRWSMLSRHASTNAAGGGMPGGTCFVPRTTLKNSCMAVFYQERTVYICIYIYVGYIVTCSRCCPGTRRRTPGEIPGGACRNDWLNVDVWPFLYRERTVFMHVCYISTCAGKGCKYRGTGVFAPEKDYTYIGV